jgi:hypothetical protein
VFSTVTGAFQRPETLARHRRLLGRVTTTPEASCPAPPACRPSPQGDAALEVTRIDRYGMNENEEVTAQGRDRFGQFQVLQQEEVGERQPMLMIADSLHAGFSR